MKYIINKEQYNCLLENKRKENIILKLILEEINRIKLGLNESIIRKDAISDILKKHNKKGNLSKYVISKLSNSGIKIK
jgi:hypothetical protein